MNKIWFLPFLRQGCYIVIICIGCVIANISYSQSEQLAELYYQNQVAERNVTLETNFYQKFGANYPCLYGTFPVGLDSQHSISDGHKFACGLHSIRGNPIVYSFGSNRQQDFETSILTYRPDSLIYVFEINHDHLPNTADRNPQIQYFNLGLGPKIPKLFKKKMMLLSEIMAMLHHHYVDIVKVDIEGSEYYLPRESSRPFAHVGQLLIEIHNFMPYWAGYRPVREADIRTLVDYFESQGLRIFHKELNYLQNGCCSEFSFIQQNFTHFDAFKQFR